MDKPKEETQTYKKIMPLRGSLLQKVRNEIKKEFPKNEAIKIENGVSNSADNNVDQNVDPVFVEPKNSPEKKIIIQKVENVSIKAIQTSEGPIRRISTFFKVPEKKVEDVSIEITVANDAILPETPAQEENNSSIVKSTRQPIKLLSAKMPENQFNQLVPLKMTRVIKQPKHKPILKNRYHRIQTFKEAETIAKEPDNSIADAKFEILVPDIEMGEVQLPIVETQQISCNSGNLSKMTASDNEEDFYGFDDKKIDDAIPDLSVWLHVLRDKTKLEAAVIEEIPENTATVNVASSLSNVDHKLELTVSAVETPEETKISQTKRKTPKTQSAKQTPKGKSTKKYRPKPPAGKQVPKNRKIIKTETPSTSKTVSKDPKTESVKIIPPMKLQNIENVVKAFKPLNQSTPVSTKAPNLTAPSTTRKPQPKADSWKNDIFAVIGTSRIKKIDESLKNIPNLLSDNIYETEIIELKLIVNHLLRILKVDSVMATANLSTSQIGTEDSFEEDDDNDDNSGSNGDNSNGPSFFDSTTDDGPSELEDNNLRFTDYSDQPGPSNFQFLASKSAELIQGESTLLEVPSMTLESTIESIEVPEIAAQSQDIETSVPILKPRQMKIVVSPIAYHDSPTTNTETQVVAKDKTKPRKRKTESCIAVPSKQLKGTTDHLSAQEKQISMRSHDSNSDATTSEPRHKIKGKDGSQEFSEKTATKKVITNAQKSEQIDKLRDAKNKRRTTRQSSGSRSDTVDSSNKANRLKTKNTLSCKTSLSDSLGFDEDLDVNRRQLLKKKKPDDRETAIASRRSSLRSSSCSSDASVNVQLNEKKRNSKKHFEASTSESSVGGYRRRDAKVKLVKPLSDDSDSDKIRSQPSLAATTSDVSDKPSKLKRVRRMNKDIYAKRTGKIILSKPLCSDSDSDGNIDNQDTSRNIELESRLSLPDSNSNNKSRNNCIASPDRKAKKGSGDQSVMEKLSTVVFKSKRIDPNYAVPPIFEKRERLRTSAFKGNECSSDEDIQSYLESDPQEPSVSRDSSVARENKSNQQSRKHASKKKRHSISSDVEITKKKFVQENVEPEIENQVPYEEIVLSIRASDSLRKAGRPDAKRKKQEELQREEDLKKLKALEYFRCGSCNFNISKHNWTSHFLEHGGIAWIHGIEPPILFDDWNELLRRTINNYKIYDQPVFKCPNCRMKKRSALGHLSHLFVCCESEETIELRKISCELCSQKVFPFHLTAHKVKCLKIQPKLEEVQVETKSSSEEEVSPERINSSGRQKRKAVQRAEKKFKKIIDEDESDYDNSDYESASDSDEKIHEQESSEETEGSSGDESSEIESSNDDEPSDNDDSHSINKKAKPSLTESNELKFAKHTLLEYSEKLREMNIHAKTLQWTCRFFDDNWNTEIFPEILPKFNLSLGRDPKIILPQLNYKLNSMKFHNQTLTSYSSEYGVKYGNTWKQLQIGEDETENASSTVYCGGSVAAIDWAPMDGNLNFLAVACNNASEGIKQSITESRKSCLQVYEFKNLVNDNFKGFANSPKLCYVIVVNDGPIWAIKFHPCKSSIEKRIGLLAVTTSNQSVIIYSLPYLNHEKSIILPIQPKIVCKLEEDVVLFQDAYLMQATKTAWYQKKSQDTILAAGFISGLLAIWNLSSEEFLSGEGEAILYPHHVLQAHLEPITVLDFKATTGSHFHMLTASSDRKIKVYTLDEFRCQESASYYAESRVQCGEWLMHWPGYFIGFDECFITSKIMYRQPFEFGMRYQTLLSFDATIVHMNVNHYLNKVVFVTDTGDVIECQPGQLMLQSFPKDNLSYFNFKLICSNDISKIVSESDVEENGIIFGDYKGKSQPKKFRLSPTDRINELQINQVCFNRNEQSYRFFALCFEAGFVRIRYLKNSK